MISKEEILRRGYVDVKVFVSGFRQSHRLEVKMEKTNVGMVPFLTSRFYIPTAELVRLAEELGLPMKHKDVVVFPRGKMAGHFAEKIEKKPEAEEADEAEEDESAGGEGDSGAAEGAGSENNAGEAKENKAEGDVK